MLNRKYAAYEIGGVLQIEETTNSGETFFSNYPVGTQIPESGLIVEIGWHVGSTSVAQSVFVQRTSRHERMSSDFFEEDEEMAALVGGVPTVQPRKQAKMSSQTVKPKN